MSKSGSPAAQLASVLDRVANRIKAATGWRRALIAFFAGLAAALALAPVYALPLMAVGFSVLILLIDGAYGTDRPRRRAFAAGWFFGFGYFLASIYWMAFSFFVQADQFAWMAPFAVLGMPAFLAFFTGISCFAAVKLWRHGWPRIFIFAAIWVLFEYARGHVLTGLPWNLAGQALAGSAIGAQTAAWYGAYGLSLVTVLLAAAPAAELDARRPPWAVLSGFAAMVVGVGVLFAVGGLRLSLAEPDHDGENFLRIVQPNIPQREKIDPNMWGRNFTRQLELSSGAAPAKGRLFIIWPENGAPLLSEATTALRVLSEELPENSVLLAGAIRRANDSEGVERYYNSIAIIPETPAGRRAVAHYDKHHLVPFGEYLPLYEWLRMIGLAQLTPYGDAGFSAGDGPAVLNAGGPSFAPLICYEVIFPGAIYPKDQRPEWLLTVTNDAWFGDTSGPRQHLDMARLRSIEAGLPMARSANTGISAIIDAKGRILERLSLYQAGRIEGPLPPPLPQTLYDRAGDWLFLALVIAFLAPAARGAPRVARR